MWYSESALQRLAVKCWCSNLLSIWCFAEFMQIHTCMAGSKSMLTVWTDPEHYSLPRWTRIILHKNLVKQHTCTRIWEAVVAQWIRPQTLSREVPSSNLLAAAVVPLGMALYSHCLVPWKGLKTIGPLVACLVTR